MFEAKFIILVQSLIILENGFCEDDIDLDKCKLTHSGVEYKGDISVTHSDLICQLWETSSPVHKPDPPLEDKDFSDGSKTAAKNYCRNPKTKYNQGPWCYTIEENVIDELCDVHLCKSEGCKVTGSGVEYSGNESSTITRRTCLKWSDKIFRRYEVRIGRYVSSNKILLDSLFPERSRKAAGRKCRNPTGDLNGPWCFVEDELSDKTIVDKEYCNIPFCNITDSMVAVNDTNDKDIYSIFTKLYPEATELNFIVRLWNPEDWRRATLKLLLCALPLAVNSKEMRNMKNCIELVLTNEKCSLLSSEDPTNRAVQELFVGTGKREFRLTWKDGYVSLELPGVLPLIQPYDNSSENSLIRLNGFNYFSYKGDLSLWEFPVYDKTFTFGDSSCMKFITLNNNVVHFRPMIKIEKGYEIPFAIRAHHSAIIQLTNGPSSMFPSIRIELLGSFNSTTLTVIRKEGDFPNVLSDVVYSTILSYWEWNEFVLSTVGERLQLMWTIKMMSEVIFDIRDPLVRNAKWFSVSSKTTALWSFNCIAHELEPITKATGKECVITKRATGYAGTQSVTVDGKQCLPWVLPEIAKEIENSEFIKQSSILAQNFCRNPKNDAEGPYCYFQNETSTQLKLVKEYCHPRKCESAECRLSGDGSEFEGTTNTTRSGRTCQKWTVDDPHEVDKRVFDDQKINLTIAGSSCRNPLGLITGPWCYTTDKEVVRDLCDIPDCSRPDLCTTIVSHTSKGDRRIALSPDWVLNKIEFGLKIWVPTNSTGIIIKITFRIAPFIYELHIGAKGQDGEEEKIILMYYNYNGVPRVLKERVLPRVIPIGRWKGFWLQVPPKEIAFGYENSEVPLFQWSEIYGAGVYFQEANFISFKTINKDSYVGVNFPCSYCRMELTNTSDLSELHPIYVGMAEKSNSFNINMRTINTESKKGSTIIRLFGISIDESYAEISISGEEISLKVGNKTSTNTMHDPILSKNVWTTINITFDEKNLNVIKNERNLISSDSEKPMLFYYFAIYTIDAETTWIVNCNPPDVDGPPINGGWGEWSEWQCDVPCGGGIGFRTRLCNNPPPNWLGKPCAGESKLHGECNNFLCGNLSPRTINRTIELRTTQSYNMIVKEGNEVRVKCHRDITMAMKEESPKSQFQWIKDGFRISRTKTEFKNLNADNIDLTLKNVKTEDTGLYMCVVYPHYDSDFLVIQIISVVVETNEPSIEVRESRNLKLHCNSAILELFYSQLSQSWTINDVLWKEYTNTPLDNADNDEVEGVEMYHDGIWKCVITHEKLNLTWITNWMKVEVLNKPSWFSYLTEEDATRILFGGIRSQILLMVILISIIVFVVLLVFLMNYLFARWRRQLLEIPFEEEAEAEAGEEEEEEEEEEEDEVE